ncbi:MAG: LPS export ABC transporter periplasmic protein LptC [Chromatiales bacterium]|nr:LPS export ABC transporter periplasmic protein LptC [Chromatiales bacterium]
MNRFGWKQLLFIVPTIVVVLLLTNRQVVPLSQPEQPSASTIESDYYLRKVHISNIGGDGNIDSEIFAKLLTHYPQDDHSDLSAPRFKIYRPNGENLWAKSKEGVIFGDKKVVLKEDVRLEQRASDHTITSRIESNEIEFEHATQKVTSRERVKIIGENYTIVAGAMELLSNERQLYLSRGVKGHYEP